MKFGVKGMMEILFSYPHLQVSKTEKRSSNFLAPEVNLREETLQISFVPEVHQGTRVRESVPGIHRRS